MIKAVLILGLAVAAFAQINFDELDNNRDNQVDMMEWLNMGINNFRNADKNNDDKVERSEWTLKPTIFERSDLDKNGYVDSKETGQDLVAMFLARDTNNNQFLERPEVQAPIPTGAGWLAICRQTSQGLSFASPVQVPGGAFGFPAQNLGPSPGHAQYVPPQGGAAQQAAGAQGAGGFNPAQVAQLLQNPQYQASVQKALLAAGFGKDGKWQGGNAATGQQAGAWPGAAAAGQQLGAGQFQAGQLQPGQQFGARQLQAGQLQPGQQFGARQLQAGQLQPGQQFGAGQFQAGQQFPGFAGLQAGQFQGQFPANYGASRFPAGWQGAAGAAGLRAGQWPGAVAGQFAGQGANLFGNWQGAQGAAGLAGQNAAAQQLGIIQKSIDDAAQQTGLAGARAGQAQWQGLLGGQLGAAGKQPVAVPVPAGSAAGAAAGVPAPGAPAISSNLDATTWTLNAQQVWPQLRFKAKSR